MAKPTRKLRDYLRVIIPLVVTGAVLVVALLREHESARDGAPDGGQTGERSRPPTLLSSTPPGRGFALQDLTTTDQPATTPIVRCLDETGAPIPDVTLSWRMDGGLAALEIANGEIQGPEGVCTLPAPLLGQLVVIHVAADGYAPAQMSGVLSGEAILTLTRGCEVILEVSPWTDGWTAEKLTFWHAGRFYNTLATGARTPLGRFDGGVLKIFQVGPVRTGVAKSHHLPCSGTHVIRHSLSLGCRVSFLGSEASGVSVGAKRRMALGRSLTVSRDADDLAYVYLPPGEYIYWASRAAEFAFGQIRIHEGRVEEGVTLKWDAGAEVIIDAGRPIRPKQVSVFETGGKHQPLPRVHQTVILRVGGFSRGALNTIDDTQPAPSHRAVPITTRPHASGIAISGLPPERNLEVRIRWSGNVGTSRHHIVTPAAGEESASKIELPVHTQLRLQGAPPHPVLTRITRAWGFKHATIGDLLVEGGEASLLGLTAGRTYRVTVEDVGFSGEVQFVAGDEDAVLLRLVTRELVPFEVVTVDGAGKPFSNVPVAMVRENGSRWSVGVTDVRGELAVRLPASGKFRAVAVLEGHSSELVSVMNPRTVITLGLLGKLRLRSSRERRAASLRVLTGSRVLIKRIKGSWGRGSSHTLPGLRPGGVIVVVQETDGTLTEIQAEIRAGNVTEIEF